MNNHKNKQRARATAAALVLGSALGGCSALVEQDVELESSEQAITYPECATYNGMPPALKAQWRSKCVEDLLTRTGLSQELVDGVPPSYASRASYAHSSTLPNYVEKLLTHVNGGAMFPGAMLYGQDGVMGVLEAPLFQTQNTGGQLTVSGVTLAEGADSDRSITQYNKGLVQNTIADILAEGEAEYAPNNYMTISETVDSKSTMVNAKLSLAVILKMFDIKVDSSLNIEKSEDTTDLFAQFLQDYYTVSVPQPNIAASAGFFTGDVTPGDFTSKEISAFKPMGYVSRVNYGREMYVRFRSHHKSSDVRGAISATLDVLGGLVSGGAGGGADGGVDGGAGSDPNHLLELSLSAQTKKVLEETNVTAWNIGGAAPVAGLNALSFIQTMLLADPTDPKAPLTPTSYVVNHFATNKVLKTGRVTDFYDVTTPDRKQRLTITHHGVKFTEPGDSAGNGDLTGSQYINGPTGNLWNDWHDKDGTAKNETYASKTIVVDANLDASPRFDAGFNFQDWNRTINWKGKVIWKSDESISGSLYFAFDGYNWRGDMLTPGSKEGHSGHLRGIMTTSVSNTDPCAPGYGWSWSACLKKEFTIDNIQAPYGELCVADPIPVNTDVIFRTSSHFVDSAEDYTVTVQRMTGTYPNLQVDTTDLPVAETTRLNAPTAHMPANTFVLQNLFTAKNRTLTPGATYRLKIAGNGVGNFGERFAKIKPVGVNSTIDTRQDENMLVPANAPLIVDLIDACGVGSDYQLQLARFRNGSWQTVVPSHTLMRDAVKGLSLRELSAKYNSEILPGTSWRLTISVLGTDGSWQPYHKFIELEDCSPGTAWMGDNCYTLSPTWIRSAATQECAFPEDAGSGTQFMATDVCDDDFNFQVVDLGNNNVGIRTADGRCAQRVDFAKGPFHLRQCNASQVQTFAQRAFNGFVQLEDYTHECMSFGDFLVRDDCALSNLTNRLQFVWTPAARTTNAARQSAVMAQSTYGSYAAEKVIDGNRSTALGEATSWSNAYIYGVDGELPQWLDLAWPTARAVSRVDLYTTEEYELRDFDVQTWDGTAWKTVASVRGNVSTQVSAWLPEVVVDRLRILSLAGPDRQPHHARINELEVY
jgi:hypothetical protein